MRLLDHHHFDIGGSAINHATRYHDHYDAAEHHGNIFGTRSNHVALHRSCTDDDCTRQHVHVLATADYEQLINNYRAAVDALCAANDELRAANEQLAARINDTVRTTEPARDT